MFHNKLVSKFNSKLVKLPLGKSFLKTIFKKVFKKRLPNMEAFFYEFNLYIYFAPGAEFLSLNVSYIIGVAINMDE
jgi:hypothetical protein